MKAITPYPEYDFDIEFYKNKVKHLQPGSRVLIKRAGPAGLVEALIGNWELNLVSIPVEPHSTPAHILDYIEQDCSPHMIVNCTDTDCWFEDRAGGELSPLTDHAIFYTSGTTSFPKGVVQTRGGMKSNALATARLHGFDANSVHLTALPLYHCNAAAMSLFGNYFVDGTVVFLKKFTPELFFDAAVKYQATTANVVPTMVADLARSGLPFPETLKYVLTAATALGQEVARDFYQAYGARLRQGYGLSEAVNFSFTMPLLADDEFRREYLDNYPPVGELVQGEFRIQDGEVQLRGDNIMRCYWNNPEATAAAFTDDGWFRTGDRGEMRDDYLVLTGRFKEIIIKGGENYSPVMIEDQFRRNGIQGDFAVVSCQDERLGENIGLVAEKYQKISIDNIKLQPAAVRFGKVQRTMTRKPQRTAMSRGLISSSLPEMGYTATLAAVGRLASKITKKTPTGPQQQYIWSTAKKLEKFSGPGDAYAPLKAFLQAIDDNLDDWWDGKLDRHIYKDLDWESMMCDYPMGQYPKMVHAFMKANDIYDGKLLEIGAGIGNFSRYVPQGTDYIRTDLRKKFLTGRYSTNERQLDIDKTFDLDSKVDCIVGVNVMHCAADVSKSVGFAYEALNPGGYLVLGEGQSPTDVWALDLKCGFIDGWWDRGGFIHRDRWMDVFAEYAPSEMGYSVYREGHYDLGGVVWLRK